MTSLAIPGDDGDLLVIALQPELLPSVVTAGTGPASLHHPALVQLEAAARDAGTERTAHSVPRLHW